MQIVNLRDKNGSQVTPKTHIDSVYTSDGISLGSKLVPNASGVAVTGNISATTFVGNLQGTADNASKTTGTLTLNVNGSNYTFNGSSNQTVSITAGAGSDCTNR